MRHHAVRSTEKHEEMLPGPSLQRVCLTVSRQLGPSNSGQESSAAAVLACAIMPSEVQKNMKKCYPAHPSNVSASRCRGSLLCPSNSRQKGRNTQPPFNPSVGSLCHFCATATRFSYRFPIFETSATALCGTTGITLYSYVPWPKVGQTAHGNSHHSIS